MLLCAVRKHEVYRLTQLIKEIDIDAFIIIGDAGQINGEGFLKKTEKEEKTLKDIIKNRKRKGISSFLSSLHPECKELFGFKFRLLEKKSRSKF